MTFSKETRIRKFLGKIQVIVHPAQVIGLDFIGVGNEEEFLDYLLHPDINYYLDKLFSSYFSKFPSLLLIKNVNEKLICLDGEDEPDQKKTNEELKYIEIPISLKSFADADVSPEAGERYWSTWKELISIIYPECKYIFFKKEDFNNYIQASGLFIYLNQPLDESENQHQITILKRTTEAFLLRNAVDTLLPHYLKEIKVKASRAAISQIMARNMSHNIGSHVMSRLVTTDSLKSYLDYSVETDTDNQSKSPFKNYTTLKIVSNDEQNGYELFAAFNSYQKSRMDFLADVTFGEPTIETSKMFFSEVMQNLDKNRILLENISGTSDFEYKFVIRNLAICQNKSDEPCLEECNCCIVNSQTQTEKDIAVSIPNDILGCHAFYLILENIIRNCAKHGVKKDDLKIYIDFDDCKREDDYYKLHIYDNSEPKDLEKLVEDQNESLNRNILESNKLRQGGWGLIEMEAAAAYLRKHPLEDINEDDFEIDIEDSDNIYPTGKKADTHLGKPNFLKAIKVSKHYGYRLFLLKPKELLIIYDQTAEEIVNQFSNKKNELRKNGIKFVKFDEFCDETSQKSKTYSYPILIFAGTSENYNKNIKPNESSLPIRQLVCLTDAKHKNTRFSLRLSEKAYSEILSQNETSKILNELWKAWVIRQFTYLRIKINSMFLNQKKDAEELLLRDCDNVYAYFDDEPYVFFSDHAIDFCKTICTDSDYKDSYSEPYNSKDYFLLRKFIKNDEKDFSKVLSEKDIPGLCRLIEGTATTIHIIDERIQELAEKTLYRPERGEQEINDDSINELLYIDLLYCTHVIVPYSDTDEPKLLREVQDSEKFNLNAKNFKPIRDKIINYLRNAIKTTDSHSHTKAKADFLLIHLGIIEKLISSHPNKEKHNKEREGIEEFIQSEILQNKDNIDTKVIIISGRGKPHNLPERSLYLNFSIVAQYCIENRLKYFLNEVVHSAKQI